MHDPLVPYFETMSDLAATLSRGDEVAEALLLRAREQGIDVGALRYAIDVLRQNDRKRIRVMTDPAGRVCEVRYPFALGASART